MKEQVPPESSSLRRFKNKKRSIRIKGNNIKTNRNTVLDFGAIAKGYAVDQAFMKLKEMGFDTILVDGGGDIRVGRAPEGRTGWKISQFYDNGDILILSNCAIATSGPDYQSVELTEGQTRSHIVDPTSMEGLADKIGVTIIADSCTTADALATAVSVLGSDHKLQEHYKFKANIKLNKQWITKQF